MRSGSTAAFALLGVLSMTTCALAQRPAARPAGGEDGPFPLAIRWWGQAFVSIETFWGFTIVIDPFTPGERMGYPDPKLTADLVLVTHEHFDHNGVDTVKGDPVVLHGLKSDGDWAEIDHYLDRPPNQAKAKVLPKAEAGKPSPYAVHVQSIHVFHDAESGAKRGKNTLFLIEADGVRILHCGDLGHGLTPEQLKAVGRVDVLLLPVGGTYTIDAPGALAVAKQINPTRYVWPIHFKTDVLKVPLAPRDAFIEKAREAGFGVREIKGNTLAVVRQSADKADADAKPAVIVADYKPIAPQAGVQEAIASMETDRQAFIDALGKVTKEQLDHQPSDKTHTIRWNFEHTTATEIGFFSQVYHALDPNFPVINIRPAQMPPDYQPRHPDWDTAEMVRHVQRVAAFTKRFSYLLADTPADLKIEGTRFSVQSLTKLMVGHYKNHASKAVLKFKLPDWPKS